MPSCTGDFDAPACHDNRPKDFRGDVSEHIAVFLLKEPPMFTFASYASLNQWFEICSTFEVWLICKELKISGNGILNFSLHFSLHFFLIDVTQVGNRQH